MAENLDRGKRVRCWICGEYVYESRSLQSAVGNFYCGLPHKLIGERKEHEILHGRNPATAPNGSNGK